MAAAEAQACGTPVVAFRRGALGEVIADGRDRLPGRARRPAGGRRRRQRRRRDLAPGVPRPCRDASSTWNGAWTPMSSSTGGWSAGAAAVAGQWLTPGTGSPGGWRSSRAPAGESEPPPRKPRRRRARTSCSPPATPRRSARSPGASATPAAQATAVPADVSQAGDVAAPVRRRREAGSRSRRWSARPRVLTSAPFAETTPEIWERDAPGQPDGLVPVLPRGVHRHAAGRRRADRQHRLALRCLRAPRSSPDWPLTTSPSTASSGSPRRSRWRARRTASAPSASARAPSTPRCCAGPIPTSAPA